MNSLWSCDFCNKQYKTFKGYKNHNCKNNRNDITLLEETTTKEMTTQPIIKKRRKKKISPQVRFNVWKTYIGDKIEAKCFCCWNNRITPFTYCNTFHAIHRRRTL